MRMCRHFPNLARLRHAGEHRECLLIGQTGSDRRRV
jgi:hypothetical protein